MNDNLKIVAAGPWMKSCLTGFSRIILVQNKKAEEYVVYLEYIYVGEEKTTLGSGEYYKGENFQTAFDKWQYRTLELTSFYPSPANLEELNEHCSKK